MIRALICWITYNVYNVLSLLSGRLAEITISLYLIKLLLLQVNTLKSGHVSMAQINEIIAKSKFLRMYMALKT